MSLQSLRREQHTLLFEYRDYLAGTDIGGIEITDRGVILTERSSGVRFWCDPRDKRTAPIEALNFGTFEKEDEQALYQAAEGSRIVFDIGANIGWYTLNLAVWLWTLLFRGQPSRPYNVGSEDDLSITDLAHRVAQQFRGVPVNIARTPAPGQMPERYVPATKRAQVELGLRQTVALESALSKTIRWHQENSS